MIRRIESTNGSYRLLHSYELEVVLSLLDFGQTPCRDPTPVRGLVNSRKRLLQLFRAVVFCSNNTTTTFTTSTIAYHLLCILHCYLDYFPSSRNQIATILRECPARRLENAGDIFVSLRNLELHRKCTSPSLTVIFERLLPPLIEMMINWRSIPSIHGLANALISLLRLQLLCPTSVVDPTTEDVTKHQLLNQSLLEQSHFLLMLKCMNHLTGQVHLDPLIACLIHESIDLRDQVGELNDRAVRRPSSAPSFSDLFHELRDVCEHIISIDAVSSVVQLLSDDRILSMSETEGVIAGERLLQSNICAIIGRLNSEYYLYEDIVSPICSALHGLSMGLRLALGSVVSSEDEIKRPQSSEDYTSIDSSWACLLAFPLTVNFDMRGHRAFIASVKSSVQKEQIAVKAIRSSRNTIAEDFEIERFNSTLILSKIDLLIASGIMNVKDLRGDYTSILGKLCAFVVAMEKEKLEREKQKNAAYAYRTQTTEYLTQSLDEEASMRKVFPDHTLPFKGQMEDADDDGSQFSSNDSALADRAAFELPDEFYCNVVGCYARMVLGYTVGQAYARVRSQPNQISMVRQYFL